MSGKFVTPQELKQLLDRQHDRRVYDTQNDQAFKSAIDASYSGGNPKTLRAGETVVGAETKYVLAPYAGATVKADDPIIEIPIGGETVILGRIASLPAGKLNTGATWMVPTDYPTTETTAGFTSAGLRKKCTEAILVNNVLFEIVTGVGSQTSRVKLFSGDGAQLIIDTGDVDASASGRQVVTISPAVQIYPGRYSIEYTSSSASVIVRCTALSASAANFLNQVVTTRATSGTMATPVNTAAFPWIAFIEA